MKSVDYADGRLVIKFYVPSPDFQATIFQIKQCENYKFDPIGKKWTVEASQDNIDLLVASDFIPTPAVKALWKNKPVFKEAKPVLAPVNLALLDPRLYPYQVEGVQWLEGRNGTGIIGLPVGLGKSNIAASYGAIHPKCRPILVVCPACVKYNWQREIKLWAKEDAIILSSKTPSRIDPKAKWVIINYDILTPWESVLVDFKFQYLIGDESAYVNNPSTKRTKAFVRLARIIPKKALLSATPIRNRPSEFYTALSLVDRATFHNRHRYLTRYCDPRYSGFGWTYKGLTNEEELFALTSKVMFRKRKEDVLTDLPQKRKIVIPFPLDKDSQKKYNKASNDFIEWARSTKAKKGLDGKAHIETLRQLAYIGKRDGVIEWISNFLDSDEKLVVFAWHTNVIDDLYDVFKDACVVVDGRTSSLQKQANIDAFQGDASITLFIGQITAAGIGINLTAASSLAIVEFPWTPGDLEQAMGRIDRIGQKSSLISFYYLVGAGTVDEDTAELLDEKSKILDRTLDGKADREIFGVDIVTMLTELHAQKERK